MTFSHRRSRTATWFFVLLLLSAWSGNIHAALLVRTPGSGLIAEPIFNGEVFLSQRGNASGPVVLFVHGLGDDASSIWDETIRRLEKVFFLITFDLPGFGKSSKANKLYSPENYVKLINYLSNTFIEQPFHLVGHSMGGAISLRYAAAHPSDVRTLTLVDAAGILHRLAYTKYLAPLGLNMLFDRVLVDRREVTSWAGLLLNKAGEFVQFNPEYLLQVPALRARLLDGNPSTIAGLALVLDDFSRIPQRIAAPTRIIWGENDEVAPLRTGHVLNALIENSSLHTLADTGHVPIRDKPDAFHRLLVEGFRSNNEEIAIAESSHPAPGKGQYGSLSCRRGNNIRYTGEIGILRIDNCKDVAVHDARIGQVFITGSRVLMENVDVSSPGTAVEIYQSNVTFTAGTISGNVAIEASDSRLDIAGTRLIGTRAGLVAPQMTTATFSITPLLNGQSRYVLHGQMQIRPDSPL